MRWNREGSPLAFTSGLTPKGFRILALPGHDRKGCPFRDGDILVRHGTASERWDQSDIDLVIERIVTRRKEQWRRELVQDENGMNPEGELTVAAVNIRWSLDQQTFFQRVLKGVQSKDTVSLRVCVNEMMSDSVRLYTSGAADDLKTLLQRLTCIGAVTTILSDFEDAELVGRALVRIYELGPNNPATAPELWLEIGARVEALGSIAVRQESWRLTRYLALLPVLEQGQYSRFLLRHSVTQAGRSGLLPMEKKLHSLVSVARVQVDDEGCLRADAIPPGSDLLIDSLCRFDFLAVLAAMDETASMDTAFYYTNFAAYYARRVVPIVLGLIREEPVRLAIYPRSDAELAQALKTIDTLARNEAFRYGGWEGYENDEIVSFVAQNASR